jgi:hypothetical protein
MLLKCNFSLSKEEKKERIFEKRPSVPIRVSRSILQRGGSNYEQDTAINT